MSDYHKYVFNTDKQTFVGRFEEMYQQEEISVFDSWHQEDSRQLNRKIAIEILNEYNFERIVDIGTGKGALTHQLKRCNNEVIGLDISPTAVEIARSRFPDIIFEIVDANDVVGFMDYFDQHILANSKSKSGAGAVDLIFTAECISYIEHWRDLLAALASRTRFLMVVLFLHENPIGFVKSIDELEWNFSRFFEILEMVIIKKSRFVVIFGQSLPLK